MSIVSTKKLLIIDWRKKKACLYQTGAVQKPLTSKIEGTCFVGENEMNKSGLSLTREVQVIDSRSITYCDIAQEEFSWFCHDAIFLVQSSFMKTV